MDKRVSWPRDDVVFLKNNVGKMQYVEMSQHLNKSITSIASKIHDLGISIRKTKRWKNEEIEFLVDNYHKSGVEECAKVLKKTKNSVWKKASILGLSHNGEVEYPFIEDISGPNSKLWKGYGEISGAFLYQLKKNSEARKLDMNITIKYIWDLFLKQKRRCSLSNVELQFSAKNRDKSETTASLDRIDSSCGYVKGNVQWVHKTVNTMKMALDQSEFINWCKIIAEGHNK